MPHADKLEVVRDEYRDKIRKLPDERREAYRQVDGMSAEPQDVDLVRPREWVAATAAREQTGKESKIPLYPDHMLCDQQGMFPAELNGWEAAVLAAELKRPGFKCWYRNPDRPSQDSLGIAYLEDEQYKILRPDFVFFSVSQGGEVVVDIVDPHGTQLGDSLPKLQGLARYAEVHADVYRRIESVAEIDGKLRVLDLTRKDVRMAVAVASNANSLYSGALAGDYA